MNCSYCHNEGQEKSSIELSLPDIKKIAIKARNDGIKKVKITGGEPLLRKEIVRIVKTFSKYFEDLSIVTNGTNLERLAHKLKKAGLNRINIGCDSLYNPKLKNAKSIINAIDAAKKAGLFPIKLNMVVLKSINEHEINDMVRFAKEKNVVLQLIELINTDNNYFKKHYFSLKNVETNLEKEAFLITKNSLHQRSQYHLHDTVVEIVRPGHEGFCKNCKRIRITSDGKVKACLFQKNNLVCFDDIDTLKNAKGIYGKIKNDRYL